MEKNKINKKLIGLSLASTIGLYGCAVADKTLATDQNIIQQNNPADTTTGTTTKNDVLTGPTIVDPNILFDIVTGSTANLTGPVDTTTGPTTVIDVTTGATNPQADTTTGATNPQADTTTGATNPNDEEDDEYEEEHSDEYEESDNDSYEEDQTDEYEESDNDSYEEEENNDEYDDKDEKASGYTLLEKYLLLKEDIMLLYSKLDLDNKKVLIYTKKIKS